MNVSNPACDEQAKLWNGAAGQAWVEAQALLDRMFKPLEDALAVAVGDTPARRVLDVGCGTGATTLTIAQRLGASGRCVGVDVSEPMIAAARLRAERERVPAEFVLGDAQRCAFEPGAFDAVVSRFGVMFFDDPVQAFANLRGATRDGGELRCLVWRSAEENPFMTTAERAAAPLLPNLPPRRPDAPGQFAFADTDRVRCILQDGGWAGIELQPVDVACVFPEAELVPYLTRLGPVGRVLHEVDAATRARVIEAALEGFARYVHGAEVRFDAACWMVAAHAPVSSDAVGADGR